MTVVINGDRREIPDGLTVDALLDHLGITLGRVAIERNLDILPRAQWTETLVQAGRQLRNRPLRRRRLSSILSPRKIERGNRRGEVVLQMSNRTYRRYRQHHPLD